jgi:hypothetical protein
VQTDLIATLYILNIYNEYDPQTKLHTIPCTLAPLSLPTRCIITGDLHAHHPLWNSRVRLQTRADELVALIYHGVDQMAVLLVLMHVYALVLMHAYPSAYAYWVDYVCLRCHLIMPTCLYLWFLMVAYVCLCMFVYLLMVYDGK